MSSDGYSTGDKYSRMKLPNIVSLTLPGIVDPLEFVPVLLNENMTPVYYSAKEGMFVKEPTIEGTRYPHFYVCFDGIKDALLCKTEKEFSKKFPFWELTKKASGQVVKDELLQFKYVCVVEFLSPYPNILPSPPPFSLSRIGPSQNTEYDPLETHFICKEMHHSTFQNPPSILTRPQLLLMSISIKSSPKKK